MNKLFATAALGLLVSLSACGREGGESPEAQEDAGAFPDTAPTQGGSLPVDSSGTVPGAGDAGDASGAGGFDGGGANGAAGGTTAGAPDAAASNAVTDSATGIDPGAAGDPASAPGAR